MTTSIPEQYQSLKTKLETIVKKTMIQYELSSSDYNPNVGSTITITCTCKNILGNPIPNKTLELMMNGVSQGTSTTNANGIATWTLTFGGCGNKHFYIGNATLDFVVTGWKLVETKASGKVKVYVNENMVALSIQESFTITANNMTTLATISSQYAPNYVISTPMHANAHGANIAISADGSISVYNASNSTNVIARAFVTYPLKARMP